MKRAGLLVLLIALIVLAVLGGLGLFGDEAPAPGTGPTPTATQESETDDPGPVAIERGRPTDAAATDVARTRVDDASDAPADDPEFAAGLAGFVGRVVSSDGEPVGDSLVKLYRFAADCVLTPGSGLFVDETTSQPDIDAGETRTDADGRFRIDGVFPQAFFMLVAGVDGEVQSWDIVEDIPGPGETTDLGDIVLPEYGTIVGTVVNQDGEPVEGALVRAVDLPGSALAMVPVEQFDPEGALIVSEEGGLIFDIPGWVATRFEQLPIPQTYSGADGTFRLTGVTPGSNLLAVTARGYLSNVKPSVRVKAGKDKDVRSVRMREGEIVVGEVVDTAGEPIADAEVLVASDNTPIPVHFGRPSVRTDAAGRFEVAGMPPKNVWVAARRAADQPWVLSEKQPATADIVVTLEASFRVLLTVESAIGVELGEPTFQLTPGKLDNGAVEMAMWGATKPLDLAERLSRDDDGRWVIADVPAGNYALLVGAAGHAANAVGIDVRADLEKSVRLEKERTFDVRVVNTAGEPVRNARVFVEARGDGLDHPEMPVHCGRTDAEGNLTVTQVHSTKARLSAQHPKYAVGHAESDLPPPQPIQLVLEAPGAIAGTLTDNGQRPELGKWTVAVDRRWDGKRGALPDMPSLATPNAEGRFEVRGLRAGEYSVTAIPTLDVLKSPGALFAFAQEAFMMRDPNDVEVTVVSNQTAQVTLDASAEPPIEGPSVNVSGTVVLDGRLGAGMMITGWGEGRRIVGEVDQTGRFDLGQVKVGHVSLNLNEKPDNVFEGGFDSIWSNSYQLEEGKDLVVEIDISTSSISGFVTSSLGSPAENVEVTLNGQLRQGEDLNGHIWKNTQTDARGRFTFEKVPAGRFHLEAKSDAGRGKIGGLDLNAGAGPLETTLTLTAVVKVSGTCDLTAIGDEKPDWMWLLIQAENGSDSSWTRVAEDGSFEFDDVVPGDYTFQFNAPTEDGQQWKVETKATVTDRGLSDLRVVPTLVERKRRAVPKAGG